MIAGPPTVSVPIPDSVRALADTAGIRPVWRNELGGVTFQLDRAAGRRFVKWQPRGCPIDLAAEAARLLDPSGRWVGHVDLGALGVGDRWADLAIATGSTRWNYGPGWEDTLLAAYGIPADPERIRLFRELRASDPTTP